MERAAEGRAVVVSAADVGVRTRRGWVFSGVTLTVPGGSLVAVAGPGGSGRTSLLLTLGGRMRPSTGSLRVCGLRLPRQAAEVRRRTAMARIGGTAEPEPELTVAAHARERALAAKVKPAAFAAACKAIDFSPPTGEYVGELLPGDTTRLALALALMESPDVVLLDDLDTGVDGATERALWQTAKKATATGTTVVAATADGEPAMGVADMLLVLPEGGR